MKYTLKKQFHPNQVEEVGHVFENEEDGVIYNIDTEDGYENHWIAPHEIALLIHAGFLETEKEKCKNCEIISNGSIIKIDKNNCCVFCQREVGVRFSVSNNGTGENNDIEILAHGTTVSTAPPEQKKEEEFPELKCTGDKTCLFGCENCQKPEQKIELWEENPPAGEPYWIVDSSGYVDDYYWTGSKNDMFCLNTKNCHKTKESAEEALKLLKSKYEIE